MKRAPDHRHVGAPVVRRRHVLGLLVSVVVTFVVAGTGSRPGATSASVVGATVPSATNLDIDGCLAGTAGVTSFGPVTSASSNVTGAECVIEFGSSNDTSQLRLSQSDGFGSAMYRLSSGSPDQTFATGGVFTLAASAGEDVASDIVRQPDGKLLVAGYYDDAGTRRPLVTRLNADGTLDPSFDGDGVRHLDTQQLNAATRTYLALDASGRAVVVWGSQLPTGSIRITRLTTGGGDDATFGTAGVATHVVSGGGNWSIVADVKVDPAGRILVSGKFWPNVEWGWYGTTARFTSTGVLDTTLAGDGTVTAICPSSDHTQMTTDIVPLPDGGFISSNGHESGGHLKIIMKWTETGVLDPGFGTNGCSIPGVFRGNGVCQILCVSS